MIFKSILKNALKEILRKRGVNKVLFGRNAGFRFKFSKDVNLDRMLGNHESNTFEVFDLFAKKGMIAVDIGANVGYFSRIPSKKIEPAGKLFAFEPIPSTFERLQESVSLNQLSNVPAINVPVSNSNGDGEMFLSHTHYMSSLDASWAGISGGRIRVRGITLHSFFAAQGFYRLRFKSLAQQITKSNLLQNERIQKTYL